MSELVLERRLSGTPERVFAAFADPFQQRRWYGAPPGGVRLGEEGGAELGETLRMKLLDARGAPLAQWCRVMDVEPGRRLVMALAWEGQGGVGETTRAGVQLHEDGEGTRLEVCQGPFASREAEEESRRWWEANLERLERVVRGEAVPCFEEFWEESSGFAEPLGLAAYTVLAGMREAGASAELIAQVEETLYTHLGRLPEETARVLSTVLRARLQEGASGGGG